MSFGTGLDLCARWTVDKRGWCDCGDRVGQRHGAETALKVAKRLIVVAQRQGGQSQFSPYLTAPADPGAPIARIQDHVMANIRDRHTLESLAAVVGMSPRNLVRHFAQEAGITPHEFIERARVDAARMMLEGSDGC